MLSTNKNQSGLTLIELLITIAVIAIVAAIAIPTVSNVVSSADARSQEEVNKTVDRFLIGFDNGGAFVYSDDGATMSGITVPARTFLGFADLNGDGRIQANEQVLQLTLDAKWIPVDAAGDQITIAYPGTSLTLAQLATATLNYPTTSNLTPASVNIIKR